MTRKYTITTHHTLGSCSVTFVIRPIPASYRGERRDLVLEFPTSEAADAAANRAAGLWTAPEAQAVLATALAAAGRSEATSEILDFS